MILDLIYRLGEALVVVALIAMVMGVSVEIAYCILLVMHWLGI